MGGGYKGRRVEQGERVKYSVQVDRDMWDSHGEQDRGMFLLAGTYLHVKSWHGFIVPETSNSL